MTHPTNLIIIHAHAEGEEEEEVSVRTMPGAAVAIISSRRKKRAPSLIIQPFLYSHRCSLQSGCPCSMRFHTNTASRCGYHSSKCAAEKKQVSDNP